MSKLTDLERYEDDHAIPRGELTKRGWQLCRHDDRPAIKFRTVTGWRFRFTDGAKPKYDQSRGYVAYFVHGQPPTVANSGKS